MRWSHKKCMFVRWNITVEIADFHRTLFFSLQPSIGWDYFTSCSQLSRPSIRSGYHKLLVLLNIRFARQLPRKYAISGSMVLLPGSHDDVHTRLLSELWLNLWIIPMLTTRCSASVCSLIIHNEKSGKTSRSFDSKRTFHYVSQSNDRFFL